MTTFTLMSFLGGVPFRLRALVHTSGWFYEALITGKKLGNYEVLVGNFINTQLSTTQRCQTVYKSSPLDLLIDQYSSFVNVDLVDGDNNQLSLQFSWPIDF